MIEKLVNVLPPEALQLLLVFFLSFLIGLEREELKQSGRRTFGGVRTFPLLGLMGYAIAYITKGHIAAMATGFCVVAAFMLVSYWFKQRFSNDAGITTELSGLVVYLMGNLVYFDHVWFACTLVVANLLLLELKDALEGLTERINGEELATFAKFMMLTAVILPLVPNREVGPFHLNPFKTWLVVGAVSGVSYGSYLLQRWAKGRGGVFLSGVLGGIYSSTVTTVVLSRRSRDAGRPNAFSGAILTASGLMYLRIVGLVALFNVKLAKGLLPTFFSLALVAGGVGWIWSHRADPDPHGHREEPRIHNPLQLRTALAFALVFMGILIVTRLALIYLGTRGVYTLSAVMGIADVDPFIMGLTQAAALEPSQISTAGNGALSSLGQVTLELAQRGIVLATACNNLAKAAYAFFLADRHTGRLAAMLLSMLAVLGLLPLLWI